jgi:outer membrane receptor for ferrienterochelin and colicins
MTRAALSLAALLVLGVVPPVAAGAQLPTATGVVVGRVTSRDRPVAGARVGVAGGEALADSAGRYRVAGVPDGRQTLVVRAIGFGRAERDVVVPRGDSVRVDVALDPAAGLAPVVTTGTLRAVVVDDSPVKVEVVSERLLRRAAAVDLVDAVRTVNGLQPQVDCGVCFTSSIRVNGMEGPYTAVLIDGVPVVSALASVYGLSGITPAAIQQIEVIKGPSSTLYGTEAMGGVINVVTKDPRFAPRYAAQVATSTHGETTLELAATPDLPGGPMLLSATLARNERFVDGNGDRFSDMPLVARAALFAKWAHGAAGGRRADVAARYYYEDRFGGERGWTRADRGGDRAYGESIYTGRGELMAGWRPEPGGLAPRLDAALNWHDQDSWYGTQRYAARQGVAFAQAAWERESGRHATVAGLSARLRHYDDDTPATLRPDRRFVPGVFAQDEVDVGGGVALLAGLRVDHHRDHGLVAAPRVNVKWAPDEETTVRLNAATGFRVVDLFTEDHAALTGARRVVVAEGLRPERSYNVALGFNRHLHLGGEDDALVLDVDAFFTHFTNKIRPDYDTDPDLIVYANLDGHARSRGVAASVALETPRRPYALYAGVTLQDVHAVDGGTRQRIPLVPRVQGVWTASYAFRRPALSLDWSGRLVGPQALPAVPGRATRSPWFSEQSLQATRPLRPGLDLFVVVRNLLGFRQSDPLVRPDDPFGPEFDTAHVYGPTQGRRLAVGVRIAAAR